MKKRGFQALLLTMALTLTIGCGTTKDENAGGTTNPTPAAQVSEVSIGLIPAEAKVGAETLEKFRTYLEKETGLTIKMNNYPDYNGVVEALNHDKLDVAYLGPLTYVIAHHKSGAQAFVAKTAKGVPYYYSYILTHKDAPYNTIEDLLADKANVSFAFGDPNSTSGSLVPSIELKNRGVYRSKDDSDFQKVTFTGSHDVTALSIQNKQVTAGAIDSAYFDKLVEKGKVDGSQFKQIWQSDKLFQYPFVARKNLDPTAVEKLTTSFLNLKDKEILDAFAADGFVKATHKDYEAIQQAAEADGRLK